MDSKSLLKYKDIRICNDGDFLRNFKRRAVGKRKKEFIGRHVSPPPSDWEYETGVTQASEKKQASRRVAVMKRQLEIIL